MARIIGVMSTFRPDRGVVERAIRHASQLDRLIVIDDGSPNASALNTLSDPRCEIIRLERNSGIAIALNTGIRLALKQGADFVLTLDQDSTLPDGYVTALAQAFAEAAPATRIGALLAERINEMAAIPPRLTPEGFGAVDEGIQSGMLISAACLRDAGLLDERLFIDCVDTEFCVRIRARGWTVAVVPGTMIHHALGRQEPLRPFGITQTDDGVARTYQYHPPFRMYYITRNNIDLAFRSLRTPRWIARMVRRESTLGFTVLTSGPHRAKHALAILVGLTHGLIRRRGKIPDWLAKAVREN